MNIKETLMEDLKSAMKSGESLKKTTLRMLLSEIKYAQTAGDSSQELDDRAVEKVIFNYQKRLLKSLADYPEGQQKSQIEQEIKIIAHYLPKEATIEEIEAIIDSFIDSSEEKNFGVIIKKVMAKLGSTANGKVVSQKVKERLSSLN